MRPAHRAELFQFGLFPCRQFHAFSSHVVFPPSVTIPLGGFFVNNQAFQPTEINFHHFDNKIL